MLTDRTSLHPTASDPSALARRIDGTTWGLLLLMTGGLLLAPAIVPEGTWLILAGAILLGASAVRFGMHLRISAFIVALGLVAIAAGVSAIAGVHVPLFAVFLLLLGGSILVRSLFAREER